MDLLLYSTLIKMTIKSDIVTNRRITPTIIPINASNEKGELVSEQKVIECNNKYHHNYAASHMLMVCYIFDLN